MITLLKNFTFALQPTGVFTTDWIPFPAEYKQAELHAHTQSLQRTPGAGFELAIETSNDMVQSPPVVFGAMIIAKGNLSGPITSGFGSLVRLQLENKIDPLLVMGTISVWLIPKRD